MHIESIARILATQAHHGITRANHDPYITHPERVATIAVDMIKKAGWVCRGKMEDATRAAGLLHDVIEDSDFTVHDMRKAGIPQEVITVVEILTRKSGESYYAFIRRIHTCNNYFARFLKAADLCDNGSDLKEGTLRDKYRFAYQYLMNESPPF